MASESTDDGAVTVTLSGGLDEWLDEHAATLDIPRDALIEQLLAVYRTTAELDGEDGAPSLETLQTGDLSTSELEDAVDEAIETKFDESIEQALEAQLTETVEATVRDELDAVVAASVDEAIDEKLRNAVTAALSDQLPEISQAVETRLDDRFEGLEADFQAKIDDVRERVIQLKREVDTKAPADHDHDALDSIPEIEAELDELEAELQTLRTDLDEDVSANQTAIEDVEARFEDAEDKLKRVAWVVSDLRDEQGGKDAYQKAVDRLKRAAAQEGISTANCENCGESVDISLLTDPQCPHCSTTVSDVRPDGGILRKKARLVTASQLESGENHE